jgi:hypothetical protein
LVAEKEDIKRDCKQLNKCEMEPVKRKENRLEEQPKSIKKKSGQQ